MTNRAASGRRGSHYERELVNRFLDAGWGALRLGASGGGGDADLPDVLAGLPVTVPAPGSPVMTDLLAVELKSGKSTTLYVENSDKNPEVDALEAFARRWGATPLLGARFTTQESGTETYLVPPERARGPTDGGRYGLPVADIGERAAWIVDGDGVREC